MLIVLKNGKFSTKTVTIQAKIAKLHAKIAHGICDTVTILAVLKGNNFIFRPEAKRILNGQKVLS